MPNWFVDTRILHLVKSIIFIMLKNLIWKFVLPNNFALIANIAFFFDCKYSVYTDRLYMC